MLAAAFRRIFQAGAFVAACMVAVAMAAVAAPPDAPLKAAVESAVHGLLTDLFAERPSGRVQWVQGSNEVIFNFPGAVATLDSEYLVVRPADPGTDGFARTVGVVRIAELQGASWNRIFTTIRTTSKPEICIRRSSGARKPSGLR